MFYTLFLSDTGVREIYEVIRKIEESGCAGASFSALINFTRKKENLAVEKIKWKSLEEVKTDCESGKHSSSSTQDLKQTAEQLHDLADALPSADLIFDIYMWPPKGPDKSDYVLFLGALRRLKDWHNAKVTVFDAELTPDTEFLQKFTSATVYMCTDNFSVAMDDLLWRGKVSIFDKIENKGLLVPGVSLYRMSAGLPELMFPLQTCDSKDAQIVHGHLGRMFEVLDEVSLSSVPALFWTPHTYKLCLYQKHPYSQVLMNYVQENSETGLLARLPVYPSNQQSTECGDCGLSTKAWKENIMADIQYVQEPEEDLMDNYEFLYFIITSPEKYSSEEKFVCHAHLLYHPYHLSGNLVTSIYHKLLCPDGDHSGEVNLSCLPVLEMEMLQQIQEDTLVLHQMALKQFLAEKRQQNQSTSLSKDETESVLNSIQSQYLEKLMTRLTVLCYQEPVFKLNKVKAFYEAAENSSDWPEKLVQQYLESQKRTLSRIQSTESMPLSSPVQPCESSKTVDIESFLKFFRSDGSAAVANLSPVRRRRSSRCQTRRCTPDTSISLLTSWPESKDCNSHDIYYNVNKAEKVNSHLNKLQEKLVKDETYSSCLLPFVVFPKPKKQKHSSDNLDLRRSPRKKAPPKRRFDDSDYSSVQPKKRPRLSDANTALTALREGESKRRHSLPYSVAPNKRTSSVRVDVFNSRQSDAGSRSSTLVPRQHGKTQQEMGNTSSADTSLSESSSKESRSERHKRRLQSIVDSVLADHGVTSRDPIYKSCSSRLFKVTKLFVMDLPNSFNLKEEMRKIAESQVKQVIEVDRNRQTNSQKKQ